MSRHGYWNRPDPRGFEIPKVRVTESEQRRTAIHRALDDVYQKVKDKRPELTRELFIAELEEGKIQISIDGDIVQLEGSKNAKEQPA